MSDLYLDDARRKEIEARGLTLPFPAPEDCTGVVSIAYRNDYGTASAVVLTRNGIGLACEHGARRAASNFNEAFRLMRHPSFCDECIRFAVQAGRVPTA